MAQISINELRELCTGALENSGMREQDIKITVDHFLENEMSGKASHGMVRIVETVQCCKKYGTPEEDPVIEHDTGNAVFMDAKGQIGTIAGHKAVNLAIECAPKHGLVLIGTRNYIASTGSMAYYLRRLTEKGLIALMGCNSVALVAPPGSRERMIGTNPVGIGIPGTNQEELIADMATSAIAYGKIMVMNDKGENVPEGALIDKDGHPSTNPEDAYDGAILPLENYKGFALGLMVELLAGPLIGAKAIKKDLCDNDGLFILAIDPLKLGRPGFAEQATLVFEQIKQAAKTPGTENISLPGERAAAILAQTWETGIIEVADKTLDNLKALATREAA